MANVVGNTVGHEPCAVLSANADEIWLKGTLGDFHIPRSAVTKIGRGGMYPWLFMCVRIHHNIPNLPWLLQFKPMKGAKTRDIVARLKLLGYPTG